MRRSGNSWRQLGAIVCAVVMLVSSGGAKEPKVSKAELRVSGLGWLRNRDQRLSLERLLGEQRGVTIDANAIEDAAFLLLSAVENEGHLKPALEIEVTAAEGPARRFTFDITLATPLPRPLEAKRVEFHVTPGVRYVVTDVRIDGLTALPVETARGYFMPGRALFGVGAVRAYTPGRLRRALESVHEELRQRGFAEAQTRAAEVKIDDKTGQVTLVIEVSEGPRWEVSSLRFVGGEATKVPLDFAGQFEHRPWSSLWQQDVRERVRRAFYEHGFPDMTATLSGAPGAEEAGVKPVAVTMTLVAGEHVRMAPVQFEGDEHTRRSVLLRRVRAQPGDPLDPISLERARYRLSRLGIFSAVDLRYDPTDGPLRAPVFVLREAPRREANLLLGYGSYEQVRAGLEFRQLNLFGLAHQTRLELVQSMKSSRGEYTYTVPEIFGDDIDGSARVFGLQRQEQSFLRQEFGLTLALKRPLPWFKIDATTGYTYQALRSKDNELGTNLVDGTDVTVASVDLGLTSDRRDNPLRPRRGFRWFAQLEAASRQLGSETDFQRLEGGAAFHTSWGGSRWIHLGATQGIILTQGAENDRLLPVNKRFFPGGESSIRGYRSGEAAPRGTDGRFIGAKSYLLINAEFEQALTNNWSVVLFGDALGSAVKLSQSLVDEKLYSIGLGVRYQTLIGPVRVEYGHNLNPRVNDPSGTLHLAVGFPF
jgi:outer membrane protein insertion porin family